MNRSITLLFTLFLWLVTFLTTYANEHNTSFAQALTSQELQRLSSDDYWLKLLHVKSMNEDNSANLFVDDERFYLTHDRAFFTEKELQATVYQMQTEADIQCRFPARALWLLEKLPWFVNKLPRADCDEYQRWRKELNTEAVILVFADTQLNSPSSMYGHTFLRFDPHNVEKNSTYLSYALNFGASIPPDAGNLSYTVKGIGGGYPGNFAANPYFEKIKEYNRSENRDLWEYKLNLTSAEVNRLLAHIWELQGINFDYYFLDENCAYRLLELLDIARINSHIIAEFPGTVIPIDTIRVVEENHFISEHYYRPSELTKLTHQLDQLSEHQKLMAYRISQDTALLSDTEFTQYPLITQKNITEAAYRYLRFMNKSEVRNADVSQRSFTLLKTLKNQALVIDVIEPVRPELGHDTALLGIQIGNLSAQDNRLLSNDDNQAFVELTYRASYHDLLDPIYAYRPGMELSMGKLSARYYENDGLRLQEAQLLSITSLSLRDQFFKPWSWRADVGLERVPTVHDNEENLVTQANAGGGVSYSPFKDAIVFALATGRIEYNKYLDSNWSVAPGIHLGYLHTWKYGTSLLEFKEYYFIGDIKRTYFNASFNLPLEKNSALRFSAEKIVLDSHYDKTWNEISFELRQYF